MNKRMFIILTAILFISGNIANSATINLRDYVVILKPQIHQKTKDTFNKVADRFEDEGELGLADIFRSFAEGGHGSGFIITDEEGENYIITNRHVVIQAEKVNAEIELPDGSTEAYIDCPVIYVDDELDLAVLRFPHEEKVVKQGFEINTELQVDGAEVWSAGFPGLLGRPGWQFAKGNITNQRARIPEMVDPEITYIIQHSAAIDPGNSGGPLLVRDENSTLGYKVAGINTWIVSNRQNAFFSLPAQNIISVLEKAKNKELLKDNTEKKKEALIDTCKILVAELGSDHPDYQRVKRFISYSFVGESGWDSFLTMLKVSDKQDQEMWERFFFEYSPIETMRMAIYVMFWNTVRTDDETAQVEFKEINYADQDKVGRGNFIRTLFDVNGEQKEIVWSYEFGHWRIVEMKLQQVDTVYGKDLPLTTPKTRTAIGPKMNDAFIWGCVLSVGGAVISGVSLFLNFDETAFSMTDDYDTYSTYKYATAGGFFGGIVITVIGGGLIIYSFVASNE